MYLHLEGLNSPLILSRLCRHYKYVYLLQLLVLSNYAYVHSFIQKFGFSLHKVHFS